MVKLRWLKDYKEIKVGEIAETSKKSAENFVSQGYAEYIVEEPKVKVIKQKIKKEEVKIEEKPTLTIQQITDRLKAVSTKSPLEQEEELDNLVKETGKRKKVLEDQLNIFRSKEIQEIKEAEREKKEYEALAGEPLTEKQFYALKKYANPDNQQLQNYLTEGIEFINANDVVRGICRAFLNKVLSERKTEISIKEQVLSLIHRKLIGEATEMLVKEIENNNFIFTTKRDKAEEVYIYKDGIYCENGESNIKEQLRNLMEEDYSEWLAGQVMAKIKTDTYIEADSLFKETNIYEIPVANGILDLKTIELKPFTPTKIFLSKLPTAFNIEATCPLIDKFLTDVLASPEDKEVFYELAGFALIKDYFMERAFMFIGNGRNGKSKSIELLKRLVGVENCASVPLSAMEANSPFISGLWKKYLNLAGDISSKDLKETAMFKQLTGRDEVSANRKYLNVIKFYNYAKLVFACNELPRVYDYSDGFWERWVLLEYPYKFVDQCVYDSAKEEERKMWKIKDPQIIDKITTPEEMSGLLNRALIGLKNLLENKKFSYTIGTADVKNRWIRKADSFMAYCMDSLEEDYDSKITKKELRKKYKEYCSKHKVGGVSDKAIKATLQEMFGCSEDYCSINGIMEYVWTGIKFKGFGGF
jgi:P4 family phage/plasmid primase-like protien